MTVNELKEILEEVIQKGGGNDEIKCLYQRNYPLMGRIERAGYRNGELDNTFYLIHQEENEYGFDFEEIEE